MVEMVRCPHCGASALSDAQFCVECGGKMFPQGAPTKTTAPLDIDIGRTALRAEVKAGDPHTATTVIQPAAHFAPTRPLGVSPQVPPPPPRRPPVTGYYSIPSSASGRTVKGEPLTAAKSDPFAAKSTQRIDPATGPATVRSQDPVGAPSTVRADPTPPTPSSSATSTSAALLMDEVDRSFDTMMTSPSTPPSEASGELTPEELAEAQRLFREISVNYLTPVRSLMIELSFGDPHREWLALCRPALVSLARAAKDMLLLDLSTALSALTQAIDRVDTSKTTLLDAKAREILHAAYEPLVALLPEAFAVNSERDRREPIIVQSLLRQVPDVRKVAMDRLFAAGLITLEMLYQARPQELTETAGLPLDVAERVVARFQRYKREFSTNVPTPKHTRELGTLELLTKKLEEQNASFEDARQTYSHPEEARRLRQERASTLLEINLVLARLGVVDLVDKLERLPFRNKAEELRRYLVSARS